MPLQTSCKSASSHSVSQSVTVSHSATVSNSGSKFTLCLACALCVTANPQTRREGGRGRYGGQGNQKEGRQAGLRQAHRQDASQSCCPAGQQLEAPLP